MKKFAALLFALLVLPCAALCETVVTSFYPIWLMALNLTRGLEDHVTVRNLAAPTVPEWKRSCRKSPAPCRRCR